MALETFRWVAIIHHCDQRCKLATVCSAIEDSGWQGMLISGNKKVGLKYETKPGVHNVSFLSLSFVDGESTFGLQVLVLYICKTDQSACMHKCIFMSGNNIRWDYFLILSWCNWYKKIKLAQKIVLMNINRVLSSFTLWVSSYFAYMSMFPKYIGVWYTNEEHSYGNVYWISF